MAVRDISGFRHSNTGSTQLYYGGGPLDPIANAAGNSGTLYAVPYIAPGGTLSRSAAFIVTNAATTSGHYIRAALYTAGTAPNQYPSTLAFDCGSLSASSAGVAINSLAHTLASDTLYWLTIWTTGAGDFFFRSAPASAKWAVFGATYNFDGAYGGVTVPYTGNLPVNGFPTTFPTSGNSILGPTAMPTIYLAYSSTT